jgi:DNA helicase IV
VVDLGSQEEQRREPSGELEREAEYVAMLYDRLDAYRAGLQRRLEEVRLAPRGGTPQSRTERDALARQLERRLSALAIGDLPLCFGRLDLADGSRLYVGRVGLAGEGDDPLLMDWRAPKAALFYSATSGSPQGVVRRRHLVTRGRTVVSIDDEVFDLEALRSEEVQELHGDAALMAALSQQRTGHMRDIVATIQREQDEVIRSELAGSLVVQGGPGTGKTAVALHRAAYLLYAHRVRLASRGVLVMGPNAIFLRYIEQVLPSLGETDVVMATARSLFPGVRATRHDEAATADLKGRGVMARLIQNAIRDRERRPREAVEFAFERVRVVLSRELLERARERGQRSRHPHNQARRAVEASLLNAAVAQVREYQVAESLPELSAEELAQVRRGIQRTSAFRALMERMWPILSPQELLNDLFGSAALTRSAARGLEGIDASLLVRERVRDAAAVQWSIEDTPLLDEAAELLGSWTEAEDRRAARRRQAARRREVDYAGSVLSSVAVDIDINAELFADRFADQQSATIGERAALDRTWVYGHVIVDEAQELSPMTWRMVFRRVPDRSMTLVGDLAQCGAPWAPSSWSEVLEPFARGRWRLAELSTNYRTPSEIMDVANRVLALAAPGEVPAGAIRSSGHLPTRRQVATQALPAAVASEAADLLAAIGEGRLAVIAPPDLLPDLALALGDRLGEDLDAANPLGARAALLSVPDVKGLEFDAVLLVEAGEIARRGVRGQNDLYVALTRATQRLSILHAEPLTAELEQYISPRRTAEALGRDPRS